MHNADYIHNHESKRHIMFAYLYLSVYLSLSVYIYIYVYIHAYTHTESTEMYAHSLICFCLRSHMQNFLCYMSLDVRVICFACFLTDVARPGSRYCCTLYGAWTFLAALNIRSDTAYLFCKTEPITQIQALPSGSLFMERTCRRCGAGVRKNLGGELKSESTLKPPEIQS